MCFVVLVRLFSVNPGTFLSSVCIILFSGFWWYGFWNEFFGTKQGLVTVFFYFNRFLRMVFQCFHNWLFYPNEVLCWFVYLCLVFISRQSLLNNLRNLLIFFFRIRFVWWFCFWCDVLCPNSLKLSCIIVFSFLYKFVSHIVSFLNTGPMSIIFFLFICCLIPAAIVGNCNFCYRLCYFCPCRVFVFSFKLYPFVVSQSV